MSMCICLCCSLTFTPDAQRLFAANTDGTVVVWELAATRATTKDVIFIPFLWRVAKQTLPSTSHSWHSAVLSQLKMKKLTHSLSLSHSSWRDNVATRWDYSLSAVMSSRDWLSWTCVFMTTHLSWQHIISATRNVSSAQRENKPMFVSVIFLNIFSTTRADYDVTFDSTVLARERPLQKERLFLCISHQVMREVWNMFRLLHIAFILPEKILLINCCRHGDSLMNCWSHYYNDGSHSSLNCSLALFECQFVPVTPLV